MNYNSQLTHASKRNKAIILTTLYLLIVWSFGDAFRKWGGLNQPLYALQMISPLLCLLYLWRSGLIHIKKSILLRASFFLAPSLLVSLYYSFHDYSYVYLIVWLLSASALIAPLMLVCINPYKLSLGYSDQTVGSGSKYLGLVFIILIINNIVSVLQSFAGRLDPINVGTGGVEGLQLHASSAIAIRAPGLFSFIVGNSLFNVLGLILILSIGIKASSLFGSSLRYIFIGSLFVVVARTISRQFLFSILLLVFFYSFKSLAKKGIIRFVCILGVLLLFSFLLSPTFLSMFLDGIQNFSNRIEVGDGIVYGVFFRFFVSMFYDYNGPEASSLVLGIPSWLVHDPLSALFGFGLGFHSPLFRYLTLNLTNISSYGFGDIVIGDSSYVVGEMPLGSLIADTGIIGFISYALLLITVVKQYWYNFISPIRRSHLPMAYSFIAVPFILSTLLYSRPFTIFFVSILMVLPYFSAISPASPWSYLVSYGTRSGVGTARRELDAS